MQKYIKKQLDIKEYLFKTILELAGDTKIYIVCICHEYELANGEQCMDTHTGKYVNLRTYEAYKKFVLKGRGIENKRYGKFEK